MSLLIPLSLYVHLPWCVRKCPYCDFNSHELQQRIPEENYFSRLMDDLDSYLPHIENRRLVSIFFGGGTPSLFSPNAIEKIINGIHQRIPFKSETEITLEANPGTLDESRFRGFRLAGVNRLSIGIQSLQNEKLTSLGRIHNRDKACEAIDQAIQAGFTNFNLDLMHGLPGQSVEEGIQDIIDALNFNPPHLSWYQLTIEPNTFFYHQPPVIPQENVLFDIQELGKNKLIQAGLQQYEVSAYAKPGHECLHNKNYWEFGDYIGIGAGAHSKLTCSKNGVITRYNQVKHPKEYLNPLKKQRVNQITLSQQDIIFEFMLNALRLTQGVPAELFTARTGISLNHIEPTLTIAREKNLMVSDNTFIRATEFGHQYLNDLIQLFLGK